MKIPIYIDGKKEGELTICHKGAATLMQADMRDIGRVVRLTVYGERAGYLGVPEPSEGRLRLTRRLTPMEMNRFPQRPEYAAEKPLPGKKPAAEPEKKQPQGDCPQGVGRHVVWMGGKPYFF